MARRNDIAFVVRRCCLAAIFALGVIQIAYGISTMIQQASEASAYSDLAADAGGADAGGDGDASSGVDWGSLSAKNDDILGWIKLDGTSIDLPVCDGTSKDSGFYLHHGFDGSRNSIGCPYADPRCQDGRYRLIYGHHVSGDIMFSQLQKAYQAGTFDGLGTLWWAGRPADGTADGGFQGYQKLCSLRVRQDDAQVQTFAWDDDAAMRSWLQEVWKRARSADDGVGVDDGQELCDTATDVIALATCSSSRGGQPWRCVTFFVRGQ